MSELFPHYHLVPKDYRKNLRWRRDVLKQGDKDPELAAAIKKMCSEDILFYINGFCWTFSPQDISCPNKPFITYPFQDVFIEKLLRATGIIGNDPSDVGVEKSRRMGASWICLMVLEWIWHFKEDKKLVMISRTADYTDLPGNSKALFWKIDYVHDRQPKWILPTGRWLGKKDPNRKYFSLVNEDTRSSITGESTTGNVARGDAISAILIDEFASFINSEAEEVLFATQPTTSCRIFNSTPKGSSNAYYKVITGGMAKIIRLHWSEHPIFNVGLYSSEKVGSEFKLKIIDTKFSGVVKSLRKGWDGQSKSFIFPDEYPFILDGKLRSPWYDRECARGLSDQQIAQELDIDYSGSGGQTFDTELTNMLIAEYCVPPLLVGNLIYNPQSLEPEGFEVNEKGDLRLWVNIAGNGKVLVDKSFMDNKKYGLGSDVSHGSGNSNSVTSIVELDTGRKIGVWRNANTEPNSFAKETVALAKWFNGGMMIWDASGPTGETFGKKVIEVGYSNIYCHRSEDRTRSRITDRPGYFLQPSSKKTLIERYRERLADRKFINYSKEGMEECLQFVNTPEGGTEHSAALASKDPTGARRAHGDEVIADALACYLLSLNPVQIKVAPVEPPMYSIAWMDAQRNKKSKKVEVFGCSRF